MRKVIVPCRAVEMVFWRGVDRKVLPFGGLCNGQGCTGDQGCVAFFFVRGGSIRPMIVRMVIMMQTPERGVRYGIA
jgi:hypothetical protein